MSFSKRSPVDVHVVITLGYCDQFVYPLTLEELWKRNIGTSVSIESIQVSLARLVAEKVVTREQTPLGTVYSLHKSVISKPALDKPTGGEYGKERVQRFAHAQRKWLEVATFLHLIAWLPWIQAVVVTGSLALDAVHRDDDVDFLLIVQPGRLWLSRLVVIALAWLKGKRRTWRAEEPNSWCFNMWLTTDNLAVAPPQRTIYTAYEVCQARFFWDAEEIERRFLISNSWVKRLVPTFWCSRVQEVGQERHSISRFHQIVRIMLRGIDVIGSPVLTGLEFIVYGLQRAYMAPHRTTERVGLSFAHFHPRDTRRQIVANWRRSVLDISQ